MLVMTKRSVGDMVESLVEVLEPKAPVFSDEEADDIATSGSLADRLRKEGDVPYVMVGVSKLGGKGRYTLMVTVSLDSKESWSHGIMQNSRYMLLSVEPNGVVNQFQLSIRDPKTLSMMKVPKFRKTRVKSIDQFVTKFVAYLKKLKAEIGKVRV